MWRYELRLKRGGTQRCARRRPLFDIPECRMTRPATALALLLSLVGAWYSPVAEGLVVVAVNEVEQTDTPKDDGFSVRKEAAKFNDALEDFQRYRDKKAWELAFRSLETLAEAKRDGMVSAGKGFFVPSHYRVLNSLTSLSPEGRQAFKLFYDAKAKQLLEKAETAAADPAGKPVDEVAALREVYEKYFISSVGDRAADRLGDALFEAGDFASAAAAWNAVLKNYPDTSIPRLRLHVKRATALARTGQWELFDETTRQIRSEFAGERLTLGGKEQAVTDYLETLRGSATRPTTGPSALPPGTGPFTLPRDDKPVWQIKLLDESLNKKLQAALQNNQWGVQFTGLRTVIPASATDGQRVYVNWLGIVFAVDAQTGKILWRNRKFSELGDKFQNMINLMVDTNSYRMTLAGERLFVTGINLDSLNNYQECVRLVCMSAADGNVKWSSNSGVLANWSMLGEPAVAGEVVYITARQHQSADVSLMVLGTEKGDLRWQLLLGTAQAGSSYRGSAEVPQPLIVPAGGTIYVVTNNGALIAVDVAARRLEWAYTYEGPPIATQQRFWSGRQQAVQPKMVAGAFVDGSTLYLKEEGGAAIHAINLAGPSLLWSRPLDRESSVASLGAGVGRILSIGQELGVIDARADRRPLKWNAPLPQLIARLNPLIEGERVLAFSPRGIHEIDLADGDTVRIFRGSDRDSLGGGLQRAPGRLISVSNLAITAYPVTDGARQTAGK
jgi:outer membrane protein assembly factor BamB